jgi:NAD(P)-dependent dehydrogenase (short-subunit alcohol dehydrogenase family)
MSTHVISPESGQLLTDKVAIVTGGGGGIGGAVSALFAAHGARVVVVDNDPARAAAIVDGINSEHGARRARGIVRDVTDPATAAAVRDETIAAFGRIDVLVNNVGHYQPRAGDFHTSDESQWQGLYDINYLHILRMTHAVLPGMIERGAGAVVNVSSVEGMRGYPPDPVYGAIKAAVIQFTKSLGLQVAGHGVRVNGIAPDMTETLQLPFSRWIPAEQEYLWPTWVPVGRVGVAEDQARAVLFLASDQSGFITGHTIPVDGGTAAAGGWYRSQRKPSGWTNAPIDP